MKKIILAGISAILLISIAPLSDWAYYRDRKFLIPPVLYTGSAPIRNDVYGDGHFGAKRRGGRTHKGIDIYAPLGSVVIASKGGRAQLGFQKDGMGKYIIIRHPDGYSTLYGHLGDYCIEENKRIRQCAVIGHVGKTGNARYKHIKPHLHFELTKNGEYLDPLFFIN